MLIFRVYLFRLLFVITLNQGELKNIIYKRENWERRSMRNDGDSKRYSKIYTKRTIGMVYFLFNELL